MTYSEQLSLQGQFLIALPGMSDPRFGGAVIYIVSHDETGAMGIMVNKQKGTLTVGDLLEQTQIDPDAPNSLAPVLEGGPVETGKGFVLHSSEYFNDGGTTQLSKSLSLTATRDVLESFSTDGAPSRSLLAVGYSGWAGGQVEQEIQQNAWLVTPAEDDLIFDMDLPGKWRKALGALGIHPESLANVGGRA